MLQSYSLPCIHKHVSTYRIEGIFRGVKFSWIWKMLWVRGKDFVVTCTRALMGVARCIYMVTVSWVNISWFASQPRKPRKFYPPPPEKYPLYGNSTYYKKLRGAARGAAQRRLPIHPALPSSQSILPRHV